jgi:hypothetical protein
VPPRHTSKAARQWASVAGLATGLYGGLGYIWHLFLFFPLIFRGEHTPRLCYSVINTNHNKDAGVHPTYENRFRSSLLISCVVVVSFFLRGRSRGLAGYGTRLAPPTGDLAIRASTMGVSKLILYNKCYYRAKSFTLWGCFYEVATLIYGV